MTVKNYKIVLFLFKMLVLSFCFGKFYFSIGFSLKPYMIICVLSFVFFLIIKSDTIEKFEVYEKMLFLFILISVLTIFQFRYIDSVFRYVLGFTVVLFCYFNMRKMLLTLDRHDIEKTISDSGILILILTLVLYVAGLYSLDFNIYGNGIEKYGVLIDRNVPRLISTASNDPNITVFYITIFFIFYLVNYKTRKGKLGLILSSMVIILTFSRGAYVSIVLSLLVVIFNLSGKSFFYKIKTIFKPIIILMIMMYLINVFFNFNILEMINKRFYAIEIDEGSGRTVLWTNALKTFAEHPVFGIGINSSLEYNKTHYGTKNYVHNTYLEVLSETGIIGILVYSMYISTIIYASKKLYLKDKNYLFIFGTIIALVFQMNFLSVLLHEGLLFVVAILLSYSRKEQQKGAKVNVK